MTENKPSKKRHRSPSYPSLDLEKAIEKAREIYDKEGLSRVAAKVVLQDLGYAAGSSSGYRTIASLTSFGLLDEEGSKQDRELWISELGKDIILDKREESEERQNAIRTAALMPEIHKQLWEKWGSSETGLPSDSAIESYLLRHMDFNRNAVDAFIKEFRDTVEFAGLSKDGIIEDGVDEETDKLGDKPTDRETPDPKTKARPPMNQQVAEVQETNIPLIGGGMAVLTMPIPISKKNFDHIKKWLELMEEAFVFELQESGSEDEQSGQE